MKLRTVLFGLAFPILLAVLGACEPVRLNPARATRAYPGSLHRTETLDIHVFRDDDEIEIVNSTARSFRNFEIWINQRYMTPVAEMPAGATIRLSLWEFHDDLGEVFNAGGFWRTEEPTPVRLVEIQSDQDDPLIGLITIRAEDVEE